MRELHHFIIKSESNRTALMPVYIHHDCILDQDTLNSIGKYIECNLEYIESCARSDTSLLQFRETLVSPTSFDQLHNRDHKIHFAIKKKSKYYTTILYDTDSNSSFLTSTAYLCAFELYLFINL